MIKYRNIFIQIIFLLLGIFIWRVSVLFTNFAAMFSNAQHSSDMEQSIKTTIYLDSINEVSQNTEKSSLGHYETVDETIARLKRDVIATGTIVGVPGQESALFQIEGMEDRLFKINTQLMDGFIIKEITYSYVVLKNQIGNEIFTLYVQSGKESLSESEVEL